MLTSNVLFYLNLFLCIWPAMSAGFGMNLMQVPEDEPAQASCTLALLLKYFKSVEPLSGAVLTVSISSASFHIQNKILDAIHTTADLPWSLVIKNGRYDVMSVLEMQEKPQCYFIILENLDDDDLSYAFDDWKSMVNWNPLAQFVVFLASIEETEEEMTEMMYEILLSFMNKHIYNVNIIGHSEEGTEYIGKTVFPYHTDNNCGTRVIKIDVLDVCDYQLEENDDEPLSYDSGEDAELEELEANANSSEAESVEVNSTESETAQPRNETNTPKLLMLEKSASKFHDKFPKDLSGCPLSAAYRLVEPFIYRAMDIADNSTDLLGADYVIGNGTDADAGADYDDENESLRDKGLAGIEYKMLETIADKLHLDIRMHAENTNLYHLFQQLLDGDIELIIGGIDEDPSISQYVSSTVAYLQDDLTWCVAKAKTQHNLFNFLQSFQLDTWLLTLLFIFSATFLVRITRQVLHLKISYMNGCFAVMLRVLGVVLTQSMPIKRLPDVLKMIFGAAFFLGLILNNVYQSFLVSILTTPRSSFQISHLVEIYEYRMNIMGSVETVRHLNKEGEIYKYIRENFDVCYNIEECLNEAAADEHLAVAVSRMHSFYNPRIRRDELYCFGRDENVYVYLVTMLFPKKYHLLHKINPIIQYVIESGHLQKWARDLDMRRKIQDELRRSQQAEEPFQRITIQQVGGSFVMVVFLLSISSVVFAIELLVYKMVTQQRTRLRLIRLLHYKLLTVTPSTIKMPQLRRYKMPFKKFQIQKQK